MKITSTAEPHEKRTFLKVHTPNQKAIDIIANTYYGDKKSLETLRVDQFDGSHEFEFKAKSSKTYIVPEAHHNIGSIKLFRKGDEKHCLFSLSDFDSTPNEYACTEPNGLYVVRLEKAATSSLKYSNARLSILGL